MAKIKNWLWFLFHIYDVLRHKYYYRKAIVSYVNCRDATRKLDWAIRLHGKGK